MFNIGDKVYHYSNSFRNLEVTKSNNIYMFCSSEEYLRATRNNHDMIPIKDTYILSTN